MDIKLKRTIKILLIGLFIYEALLMLIAVFVSEKIGYSILSMELGILVGTILTIYMIIDLAKTLDDVLSSNDQTYASRRTIIKSIIRKIVVLIVIAIFWKSRYVNVLGIVFATFGMKVASYLSTFINKFIK